MIDSGLSEDQLLDLSQYDVQDVLVNRGPCTITAGDLEFTGGATVLNPDLVIAELSEGATFVMRGTVEAGRGYVSASAQASGHETTKIGCMPLDASFSPVALVNYGVENARVENRTNLDKLVMTVKTNGSISPEQAVRQAAAILQRLYLSPFVVAGVKLEMSRSKQKPSLSLTLCYHVGLSLWICQCVQLTV